VTHSKLAVDKHITPIKMQNNMRNVLYLKYEVIRKEGNEIVLELKSHTNMKSTILEIP